MKAVVVERFGPAESLSATDFAEPVPGENEVLVRVEKAGVNFADKHVVEGSYSYRPSLPYIPGIEAVGTDPDGRRVVALPRTGGAWAEWVAAPAATLVAVPDAITDLQALAVANQGFAAWHILRTAGRMTRQDTVVVTAAAGGVGSLAVQLARAWGAKRVIALASTGTKRDLAVRLGADVALDPTSEDLADELAAANDGKPVDLYLEMSGGAGLDTALASLGRLGRLVTYGAASGRGSTPIRSESLMQGSRSVVGFWANDLVTRYPRITAETMTGLFAMISKGTLTPVTEHVYPLAEAGRALTALANRETTGKLILDVTG
ncbi:zinc-binding dehydrogenase [Micromonospora sp. NPDC002296]|uniref:quinone oxidoreductase family protein n=1 Tax=Micromonospora sp. NPDC002296 TaxID=3154271 RepID=UPI0033275919